ncbi:MAG: hypothetical protein U5L96_03695 [Owenweeksia sp.]|nr:hypothetical protein [Owenweeksia sp.]
MFKNLTPQWWMGLLIGLIMPVFGVMLIFEARPELIGLQKQFPEEDIVKQLNVQIITLGIVINAALFFLFLRLHKEGLSQGILFMSVVYLLGIFIYRFLL